MWCQIMDLVAPLVVTVALGYYFNCKSRSRSIRVEKLVELVLSVSVLVIVFSVGGRAGSLVRSSSNLGFIALTTTAFCFAGVILSFLSGFIVWRLGGWDGEDSI